MPNPNRIWERHNLVYAMLFANMAMFVIALLLRPRSISFSHDPLTFLAPGYESLVWLGGTGVIGIRGQGHWWSLVSAGYLHGAALHLLFNMLAFWSLMRAAVNAFGAHRAFTLYTLCCIGGGVGSYLAGTPLTVGASGAICGLVGALVYRKWQLERGHLTALFRDLFVWIVFLLLSGWVIPNVDNWAHMSGLATGIVVGPLLARARVTPESAFHRGVANFLLLFTVGILLYAVGSAFWRVPG